MSLVWSLLGVFDKSAAGTPPPAGTTTAGTYVQSNVNLTGGVDNAVVHGIGKKPSSVFIYESDAVTPVTLATPILTDNNTVTIRVSDSYANAIIKYVF